MRTIPISSRWFAAGLLAVATALPGCGASAEPDPRCRVETSGRHRAKITKTVNGSKLWRAFFEEVQPSRAVTEPLVAIKLSWDHKTRKGHGGD